MPQTGCTISTTATCLTTGDVSKLACTVAAAGYQVVGTGSKATATGASIHVADDANECARS